MFEFMKSKTVWAAIMTAIIGVAVYVTGDADLIELIQIESVSALAIFLRHGIAKAEI